MSCRHICIICIYIHLHICISLYIYIEYRAFQSFLINCQFIGDPYILAVIL